MSDRESSQAPFSRKHKNTLELQRRGDILNSAFREGRLSLGPVVNRRFERTFNSIQMKANMLGLLESMLGQNYHRKGLSNADMRKIGDLLIADSPSHVFPVNNSKAMGHIHWFHTLIHESKEPDIAKRNVLRTLYLESKPEPDISQVENLVLAGGGAKALSLTGAIKALENFDSPVPIRRVAGTSGGAIIAMAYAAGYTAKELEKIVKDNNFGLFTLGSRFDNAFLNQWAMRDARGSKSHPLHVISDNTIAHFYHEKIMEELSQVIYSSDEPRLKKIQGMLSGDPVVDGKKLGMHLSKFPYPDAFFHSLVGVIGNEALIGIDGSAQRKTLKKFVVLADRQSLMLYASPKQAVINAMRHKSGVDLIRGFFSDLIYDKLKCIPQTELRAALHGEAYRHDTSKVVSQADIRGITFKQWQVLHEAFPDTIKELHISISVKRPFMERFNKKNGYDAYKHEDVAFDNPDFADLPVADAVRVSMNLPPVYQGYKFKLNGKSYVGSDGGLKSNMSLSTFDEKYPAEKTIGVFYKTEKELAVAVDVERMLALPRSNRQVKEEIRQLQHFDILSANKQKELQREIAVLEESSEPGVVPLKKQAQQELKVTLDQRREISGRLSAAERELYILDSQDWAGVPGRVLKGYLETKSNDNLGQSKNLRRLAMINTRDVGTTDFKLSHTEKDEQIRYGEAAMRSLLNGSYCLENHFYYHHIDSITNILISQEMRLVVDEIEGMDVDDMDFVPKREEPAKTSTFIENRPEDIQEMLDNISEKAFKPIP